MRRLSGRKPVGPFFAEFFVKANPNDTFTLLKYSLIMDVVMATVGLLFVMYFSPLWRKLPGLKDIKCHGPRITHAMSHVVTLAVIIPSLTFSAIVIVQVLRDDLYDLDTFGWVHDTGSNNTLRVVPKTFSMNGAILASTDYGSLEECMSQERFNRVVPRLQAEQSEEYFHCNVSSFVFDNVTDCISYSCPGPLLVNSLTWFRKASSAVTTEIVIPNALIDGLLTAAELLGLAVTFVLYLRRRYKQPSGETKVKEDETKPEKDGETI